MARRQTRRLGPAVRKATRRVGNKVHSTARRPHQCQCTAACTARALDGEAFCAGHRNRCPRQSPLTGWEPLYEPARWNRHTAIRETHNCFSYAFNVNDPKQIRRCKGKRRCDAPFHQPGSAAGFKGFTGSRPKTCPSLIARILGDNPNVEMTTFEAKCPEGTSKIALVVDESDDYHFFREDSTQYWSHKPGAREVTNLDAAGHRIWDPQLAFLNYTGADGRLNYDVFCSYMCVPRTTPLYLRVAGGGAGAAGTAGAPSPSSP